MGDGVWNLHDGLSIGGLRVEGLRVVCAEVRAEKPVFVVTQGWSRVEVSKLQRLPRIKCVMTSSIDVVPESERSPRDVIKPALNAGHMSATASAIGCGTPVSASVSLGATAGHR